jgi:hypothetical protein
MNKRVLEKRYEGLAKTSIREFLDSRLRGNDGTGDF